MNGLLRTFSRGLPFLGLLCLAASASAQNAGEEGVPVQQAPAIPADGRTITMYSSSNGLSGNLLDAWGNGAAKITQIAGMAGYRSVMVTTRDFYEGARFDLATPIELTPYLEKGSFRLQLHFYDKESDQETPGIGGPTPGGVPGANPFAPAAPVSPLVSPDLMAPSVVTARNAQLGLPMPTMPGGVGGPFGGAAGVPGMPGGFTRVAGPPAQDTPITEIRIALYRDKGVTVGLLPINLRRVRADDDGWRMFTLRLSKFESTADASGPVRRIVLSADEADDFFVREFSLVNETDEIAVTIRQASDPPGTQQGVIEVRPGPISLVADVEAGTSDTIVNWDFDADNVGNLPPAEFGGGPVKVDPNAAAGATGVPGAGPVGGPVGAPALGAPGFGTQGGGAAGTAGLPAITVPAGPRIDAIGTQAHFTYPNEEQNYRVEVRVTDRARRKPEVTTSILVKVRG